MKKLSNASEGFIHIFILLLVVVLIGAGYYYFKIYRNSKIVALQKNTYAKVTEVKAQVIPGFPSFPVIPNAEIDSSQHTEAINTPYAQPEHFQIFMHSTQSLSEVTTWYTKALADAGWSLTSPVDSSQEDDRTILVTKDNYNATVAIEFEDGKSNISIYIGVKSK